MIRLLLLLLIIPSISKAQKLPTIEEKTKDLKKYEGFFNFYWDENAGKIWIEVSRFDTEILYVQSLPAGLGSNDIGLDRGLLGGSRVIKFSKVGRKLLMIQPNYRYRAISADPAEQKAVDQSFAQSTLWGFAVEAESNNKVLVDATDFLLRDGMQVANRLRRGQQGNFVIDKTRSAIYLPANKEFSIEQRMGSNSKFYKCRWIRRKFRAVGKPII